MYLDIACLRLKRWQGMGQLVSSLDELLYGHRMSHVLKPRTASCAEKEGCRAGAGEGRSIGNGPWS